MKRTTLTAMMIVFSLFGLSGLSKAQNAGALNEWAKMTPKELPVKGGLPYYDMDIKSMNELETEELEANAEFYFKNYFSSELFKHERHTVSGIGEYSFTLGKNDNEPYNVSFILEITARNEKYSMVMRNFTINHANTNVNLARRIGAAREDEASSKYLLQVFHMRNMQVLRKVYETMDIKHLDKATASK